MNEYLSNDQLNDLLRKLNACYSDYFHWSLKKAQKKHIDLFGQEINEGVYYYRARIDNNLSSYLKLSEQSMERLLYVIFINNPDWEKQAEQNIADKLNNMRGLIEKLRPHSKT